MADMLQMRGLVAAGVNPASPRTVQDAQAAERSAAMGAEQPQQPRPAPRPPVEGDSVELRPQPQVPPELSRAELRQEALVRTEARMQALERVAGMVEAVQRGEPGAAGNLAAEVPAMRALAEPGPRLSELLVAVEPSSAAAVDPGTVQAAAEEVRNALIAARGAAGAERRALSTDLVAAENASAWRVEAEQLERSAEMIRRGEADGQQVSLLEALRGPAISRGRVLELLTR